MSRSVRPLKKQRRKAKKTVKGKAIKVFFGRLLGSTLKKTETVLPSYVFEPEPVIRRPEYDYISLFEVATTSWVLRRAFRAIIQECTRNRWRIEPRFKWKCTDKACGKEFQKTPKDKKCDACGGKLKPPSEEQARRFEALVKKPNPDYNFDDFVRSSMFYDLALDDWYWYIHYIYRPKKDEKGRILLENKRPVYEKVPVEFYLEDARFIFPVADKKGHLGNWEYFCPKCYNKADKDIVINLRGQTKEQISEARCSECGGPLLQTKYVQEIGGQVTARFGAGEIIHGSSSRVVPSLFGNTKIVTVWKLIMTILAMDDYNWEVYSEGKVGSILGFPGEDEVEVTARKKRIEQELRKLDSRDIQTGRRRTSKKIRTLMMGLRKDTQPVRIPIMESLKDMQSLEFYRIYAEAVAGVYGVTPEFVSVSTPYAGNKLKIDVQNRTTQDHQSNFSDLFNDELLLAFSITDWVLVFNEIETRDMLRVMQVEHTKAAAALTYLRGGFKVSIDETGKLLVSGEGSLPEIETGLGARERERPRDMMGKPRWEEAGEPTRTTGERLELALPRIPISWYSATQIRVFDRLYAVNQDQNELYVMVNNAEVEGTRFTDDKSDYVIAKLMELLLSYVGSKLYDKEGFNEEDWKSGAAKLADSLRRGFRPDALVNLASYLDSIGQDVLAVKIDNLRRRLIQIHPTPKKPEQESESETEAPSLPPSALGEMPGGSIIQARAPFGVVHGERSLADDLERIISWAKSEYKKGRTWSVVIHEAIVKAERTIESSYKELTERAITHAKRRTRKKKITLSPDELKRLEVYKDNSLKDFESILRDALKRR